eukprot:6212153-Pleurochrysis_carterae.AAC.2
MAVTPPPSVRRRWFRTDEQVGAHWVACANKVRFDRAVELALAKAVHRARIVLSLLRCASMASLFCSSKIVHAQHSGTNV